MVSSIILTGLQKISSSQGDGLLLEAVRGVWLLTRSLLNSFPKNLWLLDRDLWFLGGYSISICCC